MSLGLPANLRWSSVPAVGSRSLAVWEGLGPVAVLGRPADGVVNLAAALDFSWDVCCVNSLNQSVCFFNSASVEVLEYKQKIATPKNNTVCINTCNKGH